MDKKSALSDVDITITEPNGKQISMSGSDFEKITDAVSSIIPQTANRSLRYDFTAVEIHDYSLQLANKTKELSAIEEERKSVTSNFSAKINEAKATCNKLSNFISNGYEYRDIECTVEYHKPEQGKKTLTRKDNKEKIVEKMEQYEWNLFNQVTEEEKKLLAEA